MEIEDDLASAIRENERKAKEVETIIKEEEVA